MLNVGDLIQKWQDKFISFNHNPEIAEGMDIRTALGVQHGRTMALLDCINDLKEVLETQEGEIVREYSDVHDAHCCKKHGCKYGSTDCTV